MDKTLLNKIKSLKEQYEPSGFVILGVFGSFARDEQNHQSDIDILYRLSESFLAKYPGWKAASAIEDIREEVGAVLGRKIDFADKDALRNVGKKYILSEVQYV